MSLKTLKKSIEGIKKLNQNNDRWENLNTIIMLLPSEYRDLKLTYNLQRKQWIVTGKFCEYCFKKRLTVYIYNRYSDYSTNAVDYFIKIITSYISIRHIIKKCKCCSNKIEIYLLLLHNKFTKYEKIIKCEKCKTKHSLIFNKDVYINPEIKIYEK
jgi:hypothetical protein